MEDKLAKRRERAQTAFDGLVTLKEYVQTELDKFGVKSFEEIETELARLQGEYRLVDDLLPKTKKKSVPANVIDAESIKK